MVDDVRPNGVLEQLRVNLAGIALNIEAYAGILAMIISLQQPVVAVLLTDISSTVQRRQRAIHFLKLALDRAGQFHMALDRPAKRPDGLHLFLVAGDADKTKRTISINSRNGDLKIVKTGVSDSVVLRASALADERMTGSWKPTVQCPVDFDSIFFLPYDHLGLTKSTIFRDNVLFWLLEDAR